LDVLYRALQGKLPFNERLQIRNKLVVRGTMLAIGTMAYAAAMKDDPDYEKATGNDRYNNVFINIPGTDQKLKVPVPFEAGYLFKSLPEMVANGLNGTADGRQLLEALWGLATNAVPGVMPQGIKPLVEGMLNKDFYSGSDIENKQMQGMKMSERFTPTTTETAKRLSGSVDIAGREVGLSPAMFEHLVRGYTSALGMSILGMADGLFTSATEKPEAQPWKNPLYGQLLLNKDLSSTVDRAYNFIETMTRAQNTMQNMVKQGRVQDAQEFAAKYSAQIGQAGFANTVRKQLGSFAQMKRQIAMAPGMSAQEKRAAIVKINAASEQYARQANESFRSMAAATQ